MSAKKSLTASETGSKARRKGKAGELEVVHLLRKVGYKGAHRGVQYNGRQGDADVVGVPGLHIEVKRYAKMGRKVLQAAMAQSIRDSRPGERAVVIWREDRGRWQLSWLHWVDDDGSTVLATADAEEWLAARLRGGRG